MSFRSRQWAAATVHAAANEHGKKVAPEPLLFWDEISPWAQDNEYILSGYRAESRSVKRSFDSMFSLHNETVNILSHLIGSLFYLIIALPVYKMLQPRYTSASTADFVVFSIFFFGIVVCLALSATFHTLLNHSARMRDFGLQLDYLGIVVLMWGSTVPYVYYGFYCTSSLQTTYYTLISVLSAGCAYATSRPAFSRRTYRHYRAAMFAGLGASFILPIIHGVMKFGWETQRWRMSVDWLAVMTMLNLTGGVLYSMRIPEKWFPYRHDIWGASHQLMHCTVVCAAFALLVGLVRCFDHVHGYGDTCAT